MSDVTLIDEGMGWVILVTRPYFFRGSAMPTISTVPAHRKAFKLRSPEAANGSFRVVRHISSLEGERMVEVKKAIHVPHPKTGETIGYQLVSYQFASRARREVLAQGVGLRAAAFVIAESKPSCTALSRGEQEAAIGMHGESKTAALSEEERIARIAARLEPEDFIERAHAKLVSFAPKYRFA